MSVKTIRNIIFDLGGVILNINPQLTIEAFRKLGWNDFYEENNKMLTKDLFFNLEKGSFTPEAFRDNVRKMIGIDINAVSYTHLRAHETDSYLVCRLLLEKK